MTRMRKSGIEWIADIPHDWSLERLQWHLDEINVKNRLLQTTNVLSLTNKLGVVPYEEKGNQGNKAKVDYTEYKIAYKDTIVANSMNILIGSVGLSKYQGCVSPVYYVFKEKRNNDIRFLNYIFQTTQFQRELRKFANGILEIRLRVSSDSILKQRVAIPTLAKQIKIADYLDKKCDEIDTLTTDIEKQIETLVEYKKSVITEAVTKGLDPTVPMKDSGIEWIGWIPEEWEVNRLKHLALVNPPCTVQVSDEDVITYTPMEFIKNGYYINNTALRGSLPDSLTTYQEGDIVIAKVTPCFENGNIAIMDDLTSGFGMGSSELFVIRTAKIHRRYLFYFLQTQSFISAGCATMSGVAGLKRVSPYFIKNCPIPEPSYTDQARIAAYLDEKCAEINETISLKQQQLETLAEYKKSMIYEYVTGKKEVPA